MERFFLTKLQGADAFQRLALRFVPLVAGILLIAALCAVAGAVESAPQDLSASIVTAPVSTVRPPREGIVAWDWRELTDEASLTVGYGIMKWVLDVQRTSDGARATMVQRDEGALYIGYSTKPYFFEGSRFGYTVMVNYIDFDLTKQDVGNDQFADYGTEVKGYVVYAVPTLYYQWGDHRDKGRFVRLGVGAGLGAARFSGTVRLSTGEIIHTSQHTIEPRLALSNFLIARWNHVGMQFSFASPRVYGDGFDAKVKDVSIYATYTYNF
jgi:hypothetical protein